MVELENVVVTSAMEANHMSNRTTAAENALDACRCFKVFGTAPSLKTCRETHTVAFGYLDSLLRDPKRSQTQRAEGAPFAEDFTSCLTDVFKSADNSHQTTWK